MKILNQIEKDILSIFEIVCVISKEDGLFFEDNGENFNFFWFLL